MGASELTTGSVIPTVTPRNLEEFTTIGIFDAPEDLPEPVKPLGPFLTSKDIKLTQGERLLLSKDPKYSLVFPPNKMKLLIETERMNSKIRYNDGFGKKKKMCPSEHVTESKRENKARIVDNSGNPIEWHKGKKHDHVILGRKEKNMIITEKNDREKVHKEELVEESNILDGTLGELFELCRERFIFNPLENSIDFTSRKATDYKLNKNVHLPRPMDSNKELQCELRRINYLKAFDKYQSEIRETEADAVKKKKQKDDKKTQLDKKEKNTTRKGHGRTVNKKHDKDPINLLKTEIEALRSLKTKIKEGELIVSQTDKSSRFAVLTKQQYLESGKVHTSKDKEISWKEVGYMQAQVNSHVWWLSHILGYAKKTDPTRMLRNIQNHYLEVPDMALLVKDHKKWSPTSGEPVPTRPIVSGNRGVNTHLSEIISELLEPLILEMGGGEVASTEEALHAITEVNKHVGGDMSEVNMLKKLSYVQPSSREGDNRNVGMDGMNNIGGDCSPTTQCTKFNSPVGMDGMNNLGGDLSPSTQMDHKASPVGMDGMNNPGGGLPPTTQFDHRLSTAGTSVSNTYRLDEFSRPVSLINPTRADDQTLKSPEAINNTVVVTGALDDVEENRAGDLLNDSDEEIIETLASLFRQGGGIRGETFNSRERNERTVRKKCESSRGLAKGDIRRYFQKKDRDSGSNFDNNRKYMSWCADRINTLRNQAKNASFNDAIRARCKATSLWRNINREKRRAFEKQKVFKGQNVDEDTTSCKTPNTPPLHDFTARPVLIGGDAIALYPSMDTVGTTELVAQAVIESKIKFKNIDLKFLLIYLYLVLGEDVLIENGLKEYIPTRSKWKDTKARSLASQINRCMANWHVNTDDITWQEERMLVALMLKVAILALMDSTCYSFGGHIYKQMWGAGIGLRASACMAKIVMGLIDRMWADVQLTWDLRIYLYFRYIDDLRLFMHPINRGWSWGPNGWQFDSDKSDERTPIERTKCELAKSLNAVTDFIQFTTEGEEDFHNNFLPTLDFQTQVQISGKILYKFFSKPMSNNLTIQYGTGLAKNTIFSALRQELIRRMTNCSLELQWDERLAVINDFIQLLVNSGHKYAFIKSLTLQALTRYKYMVMRSNLDVTDERHRPLYRARAFDHMKRKVSKMVEQETWFKGIETYDKHRNGWKKELRSTQFIRDRRGGGKKKMNVNILGERKEVLAAMFVPPSVNSKLMKYIEEAEEKLKDEMDWSIKLIEQSGTPLGMMFVPKFPMITGCPRGVNCSICGNTGIKCKEKGVIYKASCVWCKSGLVSPFVHESLPVQVSEQQAVGMDGMNNALSDDKDSDTIRAVGMDGMNKKALEEAPEEIDTKRAVGMNEMNNDTTKDVKMRVNIQNSKVDGLDNDFGTQEDNGIGIDVSYIGETARPFRERVLEHLSNLKNGSVKSFLISHWMEDHGTSVRAPEFKWQVIDKYSDALRRQLSEGLYILDSGVLNRKLEFNNNIICRMQAVTTTTGVMSETQLQKELEEKKMYRDKLKSFIDVMSHVSPDISLMKSRNCGIDNIKKKLPPESNTWISCRSNSIKNYLTTTVVKRKRSIMECSTPVSERRETAMIEMGDDSPILKDDSTSSDTYSENDMISDTKRKAGMSNEMDSMAVSPCKELSPDSMDRRLALHCADIARASVNNPRVAEMQEQNAHTTSLAENPFAKSDAKNTGGKQADVVATRSVGMDGMNKDLFPGGEQGSSRAVGMDGMNKTPMRGGGDCLMNAVGKRKTKIATRRASLNGKGKLGLKLLLGEGASSQLLETRACPEVSSPKRPSPMEIDQAEPTPSKRKKRGRSEKSKLVTNQPRITDVWKPEEDKIDVMKEGKEAN